MSGTIHTIVGKQRQELNKHSFQDGPSTTIFLLCQCIFKGPICCGCNQIGSYVPNLFKILWQYVSVEKK